MRTLFTLLLQYISINIAFSQGLSLPYYTGFDSPSEKEGWQQFRTGFLSFSGWGTNAGRLYHDYNVGGNSTDTVIDWFVSPPLNFTSPGTITMKVMTGGFSTPFPDNCEVYFGTGNPNPLIGNFVLIANLSYMEPQYQWLDTLADVPFASDSGYIAFKYKTIGAAWMTYGIDSIWINCPPVGIKEKSYKKEINIYPNPFSKAATLQTEKPFQNATLTIYNSLGIQVGELQNIYGKTITLNRDNLSNGFYFFHLKQDDTLHIEKIIITD